MIETKSDCVRLLDELRRAVAALEPVGEARGDHARGYCQALRDVGALLGRWRGRRPCCGPEEALATIREDLLAALETARAIQEVNGGGRCLCCGARRRESADPSAVVDGRFRHDPECFHAVAPGLLAELRRLSGEA